jgi:hypothetical protein
VRYAALALHARTGAEGVMRGAQARGAGA